MTATRPPSLRESILTVAQRQRLGVVLSMAIHANLGTPPCPVLCDVCAAAMRVITTVAEPMILSAQLEQIAINLGRKTSGLIG